MTVLPITGWINEVTPRIQMSYHRCIKRRARTVAVPSHCYLLGDSPKNQDWSLEVGLTYERGPPFFVLVRSETTENPNCGLLYETKVSPRVNLLGHNILLEYRNYSHQYCSPKSRERSLGRLGVIQRGKDF